MIYRLQNQQPTIYAIWETGTPIEINSKEAFLALIENPDGGGNYKLTSDLDFNGLKINVPSNNRTFSGTLDGNGHTIKKYRCNKYS